MTILQTKLNKFLITYLRKEYNLNIKEANKMKKGYSIKINNNILIISKDDIILFQKPLTD